MGSEDLRKKHIKQQNEDWPVRCIQIIRHEAVNNMHDILKNANQIYVNIGYNQTKAAQNTIQHVIKQYQSTIVSVCFGQS